MALPIAIAIAIICQIWEGVVHNMAYIKRWFKSTNIHVTSLDSMIQCLVRVTLLLHEVRAVRTFWLVPNLTRDSAGSGVVSCVCARSSGTIENCV